MQICCTIIAPSFMAAGMFFILGMIVTRIGPEYSRLRPKVFSITFITLDALSLVIQALGGGTASAAFQKGKSATKGTHIMVTGIFIQLFAITLYLSTALEFVIRYFRDKPLRPRATAVVGDAEATSPNGHRKRMGRGERLMLVGLAIATLFLYIRTIYRTIELLGGWQGAVIHNQAAFDCLDAMPVIIALVTLNVLHPGRLLSTTGDTILDVHSGISNEKQDPPMHQVSDSTNGSPTSDLK
ncbi:hypothetical protein FRB97_003885 [Tulasnella sp. 331]|nr:hypothetical protein FRB97_003885 [Tulasnella sp. 331]